MSSVVFRLNLRLGTILEKWDVTWLGGENQIVIIFILRMICTFTIIYHVITYNVYIYKHKILRSSIMNTLARMNSTQRSNNRTSERAGKQASNKQAR